MTNNIGIEYVTDEAGNKSKVLISYDYKAKQFGDKTPKKTFNTINLNTQNFKFNRDEFNN